MKRVNKSYRLVSQLSDGFIPLVAVAILLPVIVLSGFGIVALINNGQWILFFALIAIFWKPIKSLLINGDRVRERKAANRMSARVKTTPSKSETKASNLKNLDDSDDMFSDI